MKHVDETHAEADARAGIEAALAALEGGEPFAAVADRYSDCPGNGGDLGSFERGVMVEEFDKVVFAMKPGERSPIFRTPFGFHIAEVRSRTTGRHCGTARSAGHHRAVPDGHARTRGRTQGRRTIARPGADPPDFGA